MAVTHYYILRSGLILYIFCFLSIGCETSMPDLLEDPVLPVDNGSKGENTGLSYLALGDSYTVGESVDRDSSWPYAMVDEFRKKQVTIQEPDVIARTGWTTDELELGIQYRGIAQSYNLVSLSIGVNNQYRNRSVENFQGEFRNLLTRAISYAGDDPDNVFVVSIPDWGVTPFGKYSDSEKISREINEYNAAKKKICEEMGVLFIDITPISREAENDSSLIAPDGLHPSGKMYKQWVAKIVPDVIRLVR